MKTLNIICVDDLPEVGAAVSRDLSDLSKYVEVIGCDSAKEALELLDDLDAAGQHIAIIISDQVMPNMTGVQFLKEVNADQRFKHTRRILLTGLATHEDTIQAINEGKIEAYISKPWTKEQIVNVVSTALTHYVLDTGIDYKKIMPILDQSLIYDNLH